MMVNVMSNGTSTSVDRPDLLTREQVEADCTVVRFKIMETQFHSPGRGSAYVEESFGRASASDLPIDDPGGIFLNGPESLLYGRQGIAMKSSRGAWEVVAISPAPDVH